MRFEYRPHVDLIAGALMREDTEHESAVRVRQIRAQMAFDALLNFVL